jgi:hypothetical protein
MVMFAVEINGLFPDLQAGLLWQKAERITDKNEARTVEI